MQQYCRVTGNGGVATLTAAPAAQTTITATTTTNFTNTNAIASGSWYLYCTSFDGSVAKLNIYYNSNMGTFATTSQGQLPVTDYYPAVVAAAIGGTNYIYVMSGISATSTVYKATVDSSGNVGSFATTSQGQLPQQIYRGDQSATTATIGGTTYLYFIGSASYPGGSALSTVYKATVDTSGNIGTFATTSQAQLPQGLYSLSGTFTHTVSGTSYVYVIGGYCAVAVTTVYKATIDISGNIGAFATITRSVTTQKFSRSGQHNDHKWYNVCIRSRRS